MIKYLLLFILKRIIKILNFNKRFLIKFAPFKFIYLKIITLLLFIKTLFNVLKGYKIFKFLSFILRLLSFSSLFINFILFILLLQLDIVGWTPQFNWLPEEFWGKDWLIDLWNKLVYFISKIWNWFTDYLSYILTKILDILKGKTPDTPKEPIIMPDKYKFGDIDNKRYIDNLLETLDDYKLYILIGMGVLAIGILTYTYWDSIKNIGRRGNDDGPDPELPEIPSPIASDPSSGRDSAFYPEGYLQMYSRKLGDLVEKIKTRSKELFSLSKQDTSGLSSDVSTPKGLYRLGDQLMWKGLPVPRVEHFNGIDYYITLDKDNYINIIDSSRNYNVIELINPITGNISGTTPLGWGSKEDFLRNTFDWYKSNAKGDSVLFSKRNDFTIIGRPGGFSLDIEEEKLPNAGLSISNIEKSQPIPIPSNKGKEKMVDNFQDIPLGPTQIKEINPSDWSDNSATPKPSTRSDPGYWSDNSTTPKPSTKPLPQEYIDFDNFE